MASEADIVTEPIRMGSDCTNWPTRQPQAECMKIIKKVGAIEICNLSFKWPRKVLPSQTKPLKSNPMNDNAHFSYQQVLDSIQEMRSSLRPDSVDHISADWETTTPFWEEGTSLAGFWFEDCEFDPRGSFEE